MKINKIHDNIWKFKIPQPYFEPNNVYFINDDIPILIDSGHLGSFFFLQQAFSSLQIDLFSLNTIFHTHPHVDHIGGAVVISEINHKNKPSLAIHKGAISQNEIWKNNHSIVHNMLNEIFNDSPQLKETYTQGQIYTFANHYFPIKGAVNFDYPLLSNDKINTGKYTFTVVETPGHSPWHLCFYEEKEGLLFSGDLLLHHGTPIITVMGDNHAEYLQSLEKIEEIDAKMVFPGHGNNFDSTIKAAQMARRHYFFLENSILRLLEQPVTAYEIVFDIFKSYLKRIEFAFFSYARVRSHLDYLVAQGRVKVIKNGEEALYYLAS